MTIEEVMRDREVVSLAELAELLASDPATVQQELDSSVREGRIECLRPVASAPRQTDNRAVFYRQKKPSDASYLWELELGSPRHRESTPAAVAAAPGAGRRHAERPLPLNRLFRFCVEMLVS